MVSQNAQETLTGDEHYEICRFSESRELYRLQCPITRSVKLMLLVPFDVQGEFLAERVYGGQPIRACGTIYLQKIGRNLVGATRHCVRYDSCVSRPVKPFSRGL